MISFEKSDIPLEKSDILWKKVMSHWTKKKISGESLFRNCGRYWRIKDFSMNFIQFHWKWIIHEWHVKESISLKIIFALVRDFWKKSNKPKVISTFLLKSDILWKKWYPIGKKWYPLKKSDVPLGSESFFGNPVPRATHVREYSLWKFFFHWFRIFWKSQRKKKWYPLFC